jgi:hypothetical protein
MGEDRARNAPSARPGPRTIAAGRRGCANVPRLIIHPGSTRGQFLMNLMDVHADRSTRLTDARYTMGPSLTDDTRSLKAIQAGCQYGGALIHPRSNPCPDDHHELEKQISLISGVNHAD